jgi:predicted amidophosphoribosyltransferase
MNVCPSIRAYLGIQLSKRNVFALYHRDTILLGIIVYMLIRHSMCVLTHFVEMLLKNFESDDKRRKSYFIVKVPVTDKRHSRRVEN